VAPEQLGDGEHQVGGRRALAHLAEDLEADHRGQQHGQGLAQHGGLRLDAAHAPAEHAESVDHRGVRVGADEGVGVGLPVVGGENDAREVLEVHLVADAGPRWDDLEALEAALSPAQQLVALDVALVLDVDVVDERRRGSRALGDDRVVDDELDGHEGVDAASLTTERGQRVAHGSQIDHGGDAGEVLHEHALGGEGDLFGVVARTGAVRLGSLAPRGDRLDVAARTRSPSSWRSRFSNSTLIE